MAIVLAVAPVLLAHADDTEKDWALVNVSVCNLRVSGSYDAGMETQALLGMPVKILQHGMWTQVQTPDEDVAWVLRGSLVPLTRQQLSAWNRSRLVVVTDLVGFVYSQPSTGSQIVSDVVAGNRLKMVGQRGGFYQVAYPDGRRGYLLRTACKELNQWRSGLKTDAQSIIASGKRMIGFPYMWGGTSTKGMDCSGFVRTALLMHDIIIPRNASQQALKGQHIEIAPDFSNLQKGDLLFFGSKADSTHPARVHHVGIYMGNKRFIHSLNWVHTASFNPDDSDYDAYDLHRLLWAQRVLPYIDREPGLTTTKTNPFYQ